MGRKKLNKIKWNVPLRRDLARAFEAAKPEGMDRNQFIESVMFDYLNRHRLPTGLPESADPSRPRRKPKPDK